jgi:AcrR family transcriptional regulator
VATITAIIASKTTAAAIRNTLTHRGILCRSGGSALVDDERPAESEIFRDMLFSITTYRHGWDRPYGWTVPKLWAESVETHRQEVRDAILDTVGELIERHGLLAVTMSEVASRTGIGRATLYKYFADVNNLLISWHRRRAAEHLQTLTALRDRLEDPAARLTAVLEAYARICQQRGQHTASELGALLHHDEKTDPLRHQLHDLLTNLIADAAHSGSIRRDIPASELASYCLHALAAASDIKTAGQRRRLVEVVRGGLSSAQ